MGRKAEIIGTATDANGVVFDVRERRATEHGWMLHIGWPKGEPRGRGCGGVRTILTAELADYLTRVRPRDVKLPIGGTTIKSLRKTIGLNWSWEHWWMERKSDLLTMTLEKFGEKHACSVGAASQRRRDFRMEEKP